MAVSQEVAKTDQAVASPVDPAQALTASKALLAYIKKKASEDKEKAGKRNLLDEAAGAGDESGLGAAAETPIWLTISTKRHVQDSRRLQPVRMTVPHALNTDTEATICLITADPQRAYKNLVASEAFPAALRQRITRVVDLAHLKKKFKSYEAQRKLFAEHDIFLGDERVINRLPQALGKTFYRSTAKRPLPVVLRASKPRGVDGKKAKGVQESKKDSKRKTATAEDEDEIKARAVAEALATARKPAQMAAEIERAIGSAVVHLAPTTNTAIKVGLAGWPAEHVAANVQAVARAFVGKYVPQQWRNVKGVFVKGPETMALPIWETDELWLDGAKDVVADGSEQAQAIAAKLAAKREKANVGKKRKAAAAEASHTSKEDSKEDSKENSKDKAAPALAARPAKKAKQQQKQLKQEKLPESQDDSLDKQIAAQKEKLRKQKNAAKKAMGI